MRIARLVGLFLLIACGHGHRIDPIASRTPALDLARARPVLDPVRGKFTIKLHSEKLGVAATTTGGVLVDRPGHLRFDLFGPFGGSLFTAVSDGLGLSILDIGKQRQFLSVDAEKVLREASGGVAGLDDVIAMLVGDLPFDAAEVRSTRALSDPDHPQAPPVEVVFAGPKDTSVVAVLDSALGTPRTLTALDAKGAAMVTATYADFTPVDTTPMPTAVTLDAAPLDLHIDIRFRSWEILAEPPAFDTATPPGFTATPLEDALRKIAGPNEQPQPSR